MTPAASALRLLLAPLAAADRRWGPFTSELRSREDLDITPSPDRRNLDRLAAALQELDARLRDAEGVEFPLDRRSLASAEILTMTTRAGWLDICARPSGGQSYETLAPKAHVFNVMGRRVRVASLDDLIRSKAAAGRPKDIAALPTLRALQALRR